MTGLPQKTIKFLTKVLGTPSVSILSGQRGEGKTALGCLALECGHEIGLSPRVVGIPESKMHLLPDYIELKKNPFDIKDNAVVFFDEAYLYAFAREHDEPINKTFGKLLGSSRHKNHTAIFATHTLRKLDVDIVIETDNLIMKKPSRFHADFERQQIKKYTKRAIKWFENDKRARKNSQKYALIWGDKREGKPIRTPLPTFWSEELSKAFSGKNATNEKLIGSGKD